MNREAIKDLVLGVALAAVGVYALVHINLTEGLAMQPGGLTYRFFPRVLSVVLAVLSLGYVGSVLWRTRRPGPIEERDAALPSTPGAEVRLDAGPSGLMGLQVRLVATLVLLLAYVFLIRYANFIVATILFLFVMFYVYGQRRLLRSAAIALIGGTALGAFLLYGLKLPLR
ncbi:MAG: tripartite tricarboxylate transporter TctB family protein [Alphaproteobacteria bacterium]